MIEDAFVKFSEQGLATHSYSSVFSLWGKTAQKTVTEMPIFWLLLSLCVIDEDLEILGILPVYVKSYKDSMWVCKYGEISGSL